VEGEKGKEESHRGGVAKKAQWLVKYQRVLSPGGNEGFRKKKKEKKGKLMSRGVEGKKSRHR